jgi:hypothetical protein
MASIMSNEEFNALFVTAIEADLQLRAKIQKKYTTKKQKRVLSSIKYHYKLSKQDYITLLVTQKCVCAICGGSKALVVDHCHSLGHVRGLLCRACNTGLGFFGDSIERLEEAVKYLKKS